MKVWLLVLAVAACSGTHGTSTGNGSAPPATGAKTCDDVRPRVQQLYRGEAQIKEPTRVDEAVADNTAMVMNDCAKDPAKRVPCLAKVDSVPELEKQCLIQLDDDGTDEKALTR
jgi:hypothetical protein